MVRFFSLHSITLLLFLSTYAHGDLVTGVWDLTSGGSSTINLTDPAGPGAFDATLSVNASGGSVVRNGSGMGVGPDALLTPFESLNFSLSFTNFSGNVSAAVTDRFNSFTTAGFDNGLDLLVWDGTNVSTTGGAKTINFSSQDVTVAAIQGTGFQLSVLSVRINAINPGPGDATCCPEPSAYLCFCVIGAVFGGGRFLRRWFQSRS